MTRFVAALLIASGDAVRAETDPRTPGAGELSDVQRAALLTRAHYRGRAQRIAGIDVIKAAGYRIRLDQQHRGEGPQP